jgi:D-alanine-D-alanine ligase
MVFMVKNSKHIEIVRSTTKGLGSMSRASSDAAVAALSKHFASVRMTVVNDLPDLRAVVARKPDLVFLGMEYVLVDSPVGVESPYRVWLSDFLDKHGIAYTGSGRAAHELGRNKPLAKQRILDANSRTSAYRVISQGQPFTRDDIPLAFPMFVKPTDRGGGVGIDEDSVVYTFAQLRSKVAAITTQLQADSLVEEYLPGREFSVAILKDQGSAQFMVMPIELVAPQNADGIRLLGSQVKSSNTEQALRVTDESIKSSVTDLALNVFHALGARDYGRIDIRLDAAGTPHFLEANLIPSLISGYGSFPKACVLNVRLDYEPMMVKIANLGLARRVGNIEDSPEPITLHSPAYQY